MKSNKMSYAEFVSLCKTASVRSMADYQKRRTSLGTNLPANPSQRYGDEWPGWDEVLA